MIRGAVGGGLLLALGACLSSAPPAPAVRWFDPLPSTRPTGRLAGVPRVTAAPHLGREFLVRVGARELVVDPLHSWISPPREVLAALLGALAPAATPGTPVVEVQLVAFEIDLVATPRAHVRCELRLPNGEPVGIEAWVELVGQGPEPAAAAMATALQRVVERVVEQVAQGAR